MKMQRSILTAFVVSACLTSVVFAQPKERNEKPVDTSAADAVSEQASQFEAELGKYNDTAPEAADAMAKLADLYYAHSRVFGLIRVANRFVAAHSGDKRHKSVMLKLIDGLEATSRNKDLAVACRQFLIRYSKAPEAAAIEVRLARTLAQMSDVVQAANAHRVVWRRQPNTPVGRGHGVEAIRLYSSVNNVKVFTQAAELAEEMLDRLPGGEYATRVGMRGVYEWRRAGQYAKSNVVANKLLKKGMPRDKIRQRELHNYMAQNYGNLAQHANAVASLRKVRGLEDSPYHHLQMIVRMHHAAFKPAQMESVVNEYVKKYPQRVDHHQARSYLAQAYLRAKDKKRAVVILASLLRFDAVTNSNASVYVRENGIKPAKLAETERVLRGAMVTNQLHAGRLRYVLAFELFRDRLKDTARTKQMLRELLKLSPTNDGLSSTAMSWLLSNAADENEFKADVGRIIAARKQNIDLANFQLYLGAWAKQARRQKGLKSRVAYVQAELAKADQDPLVKAWSRVGTNRDRKAESFRTSLLASKAFNTLNDRMALTLLRTQAEYFRSYAGTKRRSEAAGVYAQMCKRFPKDFQAAVWYLQAATDYNPPEVGKEAALHLMSLEPESGTADLWRRLMLAASRNKDAALAKRAYAWILKSEQKFGKQPIYGYYIGDLLVGLKLEKEAVERWTSYVPVNRNHYDSSYCASRLLARLEGNAKVPFINELLKHNTDFDGQYASWLAAYYLEAGNLNGFEKVLRDARRRQDERPFANWTADLGAAINWVNGYRANKEATSADKTRVFKVVRDLKLGRASAIAALALLELSADDAQPSISRLLEHQAVTRLVGNEYYDWDQLMPFVQAALTRKDYVSAATLLTGMLSNITNARPDRIKTGRELIAQCYSRMGAVGLTIDENSPIAPLLQAALYLRLGDELLAFETYTANKNLFNQHRNEAPVDLVLFVCDRHMAAGGEENHSFVEDVLRGWQVKNNELMHIDVATKARVQLMLAKNFFKAQRYDLARSEFTTVMNRYQGSPQAIEAEFGIGETFMAQKVYDQADNVFEKLTGSRDVDIVVRAEFLRGVLAHRRGDRDEARDIFRRVLDRVPSIELANEALFNLAEVYGDEERYIDQLNLLRTVGRLGRASKRVHRPGVALSIVVQDSDLGISRGHNKIPVRVTTVPGGDSELIYLTSGGAGKGLFRYDLETRLGQVVKGDHVLQLTGRDTIQCDYPDEFKAEFKRVPLSDVDIRIAADAKFEISSSKIVDREEESFSERLEREAAEAENADRRVSQNRPTNQIKPGNLIYVRVQDPDRDLGDAADKVLVKLLADSGDQVQVSLTETGPHTGVFEGTMRTAELPAGALASDTSIEHSPLMAIDRDPNTFWLSEPDGASPKTLSIDMKDLKLVSRVKLTTPQADRNAPVRGTLLGSNDGLFWFRLASKPAQEQAQPVAEKYGQMTKRVFAGRYTTYTTWNQIVNLSKNAKPIEAGLATELSWQRPEDADDANKPMAVVWHGKLVQERDGAARILVQGGRTALALDGRLELPLGPGGRTIDVWLERGTHDLTIFAATNSAVQGVSATWMRADHGATAVRLAPFSKLDFDLDQPAAQLKSETTAANTETAKTAATSKPADTTKPPASEKPEAEREWEFRFKPIELRYVRFVIHEYLGEAVAISNIEVAGHEPETLYIPTETDVLSLATNGQLEIAGGDVVRATYTDEFTQSESGRSRLLSGQLTATFYNAQVTPVAYDFERQTNGSVVSIRKQLMRIDPGDRFIVEIVDYDHDQSGERDTVKFQILVNDGEPVELTATETEEYSGIFTKEVDTSSKKSAGKLRVQKGDRIYCRYLDIQNTFPGHAVPRETVVYVNEPSEGSIRVLETRVIAPRPGSTARPRVTYRIPDEGVDVTGVAFEAPLTIEVFDPDAAKDDRSKVTVALKTTDGVVLNVECVVSNAFVPRRQVGLGNWALREGRFVGQVILQLGGQNSPELVPLSADMPRNLIGGPAIDDDESQTALDRTLTTRVLNVTGKDIISATYRDQLRPKGGAANLLSKGRLIANGKLACTDREYEKELTQLHVGEKLFLQVTDADRDTSDDRDTTSVEITTEFGEKELVQLHETLAHSGIFTGSVSLKPNDKPTPGNLKADDPIIETYFGDTLRMRYIDKTASTPSGELEVLREVPVVIGTDGLVSAFSKTFNDENLAVETKFHVAESYFELFKSHKKLGRQLEEKNDLEAGRRVLREVMEDYPDPKYVPRIAYLLGQFSQELQHWEEAIESYETIVRRYPDHTLAADAQYKLAQCYEESGSFDRALEAYVTLAATYPKSPLIASVMIRISDHFYKSKKYDVAAQVGEKFSERFESHQYASRMAFRVGQCYYKSEQFPKAGEAFDQFAKHFPDDGLCADALFWSGESFRMGRNNQQAFRRYNRCRWDFPASDAAKYSRGRLALPEMLAQFEAEANSLDDQDQ